MQEEIEWWSFSCYESFQVEPTVEPTSPSKGEEEFESGGGIETNESVRASIKALLCLRNPLFSLLACVSRAHTDIQSYKTLQQFC